MGVVNVTPDSFSDGGEWFSADAAIAHGFELVAQGSDIVDIGGESTRPGARRPGVDEELRRVLPVIRELVAAGAVVSIDTMRASVAGAALDAGAAFVNDVSGGQADAAMASVVAAARVPFVVMHWRGHSADMQTRAVYEDVVAEVCAELAGRVTALTRAGVRENDIILDPGIGFAKTADQNWELLRGLDQVVALGHRVLLGTSRKAFLGRVGRPEDQVRPPLQRDVATAVTTAYAASRGVWGVRVHDVVGTRDALDVAAALAAPTLEESS
ncbi:MAG: dihydropteroate synthase [Phycicoccus sp.]|nr:dihydropteroate synthase [Phycicoccus sp.]